MRAEPDQRRRMVSHLAGLLGDREELAVDRRFAKIGLAHRRMSSPHYCTDGVCDQSYSPTMYRSPRRGSSALMIW